MEQCSKCENSYQNLESLIMHNSRTHSQTPKEFYLERNNLTSEPTCKCGCGGSLKFLNAVQGFREYAHGHAARVNNNYQTEKSVGNSLKTRRKMIVDGTWKPFFEKETGEHWMKGLTKDTDERVTRLSEALRTPENHAKFSLRMKEGRLNGIIRSAKGPEHRNWKGGVSTVIDVCYSYSKLYKEWKFPHLKAANFKCSKCLSTKELQVHHNEEKMSDIIRKVMKDNNICLASIYVKKEEVTLELKENIAKLVADYHLDNKVSGEVVCKECHKKEHPSLNF